MEIAIIKSKLRPPKPKGKQQLPARIRQRFEQVPQFPLTLLQAPPGYGKSTSLALVSVMWKGKVIWYKFTAYDRDPWVFLTHLGHSLGATLSHFQKDEWQEEGGAEEPFGTLERAWYQLIQQIEEQEQPCYLILDNFHWCEEMEGVRHLIARLLQHQPANLHLILSTRRSPPLVELNRLRMQGELLEMKQAELAWQMGEIQVFFQQEGIPLTEVEAEQIYGLTEGWVMLIVLIGRYLSQGYSLPSILSQLHQLEMVQSYFEAEILTPRSSAEQEFLLATSLSEVVDPELTNYLLDWEDSAPICHQLVEEGVFHQLMGEERFCAHPLLRQVLIALFKKRGEASQHLLRKAVHYYEMTGQYDETLSIYLQLADWDNMVRLLELHGEQWLAQGRIQFVQQWLAKIPVPFPEQPASLFLLQGDIDRLCNRFPAALAQYRRAGEVAMIQQDPYWQSRALEGEARVYLDTIQPAKADRLLREATRILGGKTQTEHKAALLELLAENQINLGQHRTAEKLFRIAKEIRHEVSRGELEARLLLRTGRLRAAVQALEQLQAEEGESRVSRFHRDPSVLLSLLYAFQGEREEAKRMAEKGIFTGNTLRSPFVEAVGWIRLGHASQLFEQYEAPMILQCYQTAIELFERLQVERGKVEAYMGMSLLYGSLRQGERARYFAQLGLGIAERSRDFWMQTLCSLSHAYSYVMEEQWEQAQQELGRVYQRFTTCGDNFGASVTMLWLVYTEWRLQAWNRLQNTLPRLLQHIQQGGYHFLFRNRSLFGPQDVQMLLPMLVEAQKQGIASQYIEPLLEELGFERVDLHPGYTLRIQTLGEFRVWLGKQEVKERSWQREKARQLFQLLLTFRKQLLPREVIYQLLWPDSDEKAANRDFKVALNALMKALEPNRLARSTPFYIQRHGTSYGFNLASGYELDAELFEY